MKGMPRKVLENRLKAVTDILSQVVAKCDDDKENKQNIKKFILTKAFLVVCDRYEMVSEEVDNG